MASITRAGVVYPESDGKPMAETPVHRDVMTELIATLQDWFAADPMVYVSGNMFVYYVEGDPRRNVSPDVMVVRGVDKSIERGIYKTWVEGGRSPDLVIEVSSPKTRREDLRHKFQLYQDALRVPEYYLFDPLGEYLDPPLQGHRLVEGTYRPIDPEAGRLPSRALGLHLEAAGRELRLFDPAAGRRLPTRLETIAEQRTIGDQYRAMAEQSRAFLREVRDLAERHRAQADEFRELVVRQGEILMQQGKLLEERDAALKERDASIDRLRRELDALRAARPPGSG